MGRVEGKVALITGAGRGQGRSHAQRLAEEGADIVAIDVCGPVSDALPYTMATSAELDETAELVRACGPRCITATVDVRHHADLLAVVEQAIAELGTLDVIVANAGVISSGRAWELSEEAWDAVMDVNLKGAWNTARAAIPAMIDAGTGGSIIFICSTAGIRGHVPYAHYVASKHGIVGLMRALSNELASHRIRVNTVHPTGVSETGLDLGAPIEQLVAEQPLFGLAAMNTLADFVEPRDVSNAVLWLASEEARFVTGLQLTVDAGNTTKP